jgi:hypothetical protein
MVRLIKTDNVSGRGGVIMADKLDNLKKGKRFKSGEKATKEAGRKGGINSGKSKQEVKRLKETLLQMLEEDDGYKKMCDVAMTEMSKGNAKFWELIRDTIGERPKDEIKADINGDVNIVIDLED